MPGTVGDEGMLVFVLFLNDMNSEINSCEAGVKYCFSVGVSTFLSGAKCSQFANLWNCGAGWLLF